MATPTFTPTEASALTNLPISAVRRLIDRRMIRTERRRSGRSISRHLSFEQLVYLGLEAEGLALLPVATRRKIAKQIEDNKQINEFNVPESQALTIKVKGARKRLTDRVKKLQWARSIIVEDPG